MANYTFQQHGNGPKPRCRDSVDYDDEHFYFHGDECRKRHRKFYWQATADTKGTIIADSILKWVREMTYLDCQAIPGLRLDSAFNQILNGNLIISNYEYVIVHVGTNSFSNMLVRDYMENLWDLTSVIKFNNRFGTIGISSILPRPKDSPEQDDYRREINGVIKKWCKSKGYQFLKSWIGVEKKDGTLKDGVYADDNLHLNDSGINAMRDYFQGAMGGMMELKLRTE